MGWENHRNAKPTSRAERISERLANFGKERRVRQDIDLHMDQRKVRKMRTAPGGSTPQPQEPQEPKKMSRSEKRAADKILDKGRQRPEWKW